MIHRQHTLPERVLAECRPNDPRLREDQRHRKRPGLEHRLELLGGLGGEAARDRRAAVEDGLVDARSGLHGAVEHDSDELAHARSRVVSPLLRPLGVHREVDLDLAGVRVLGHRGVSHDLASEERRVGALLDLHALLTRADRRDRRRVGDRSDVHELQLTGASQDSERLLGVLDAGDLNEQRVVALALDRCFAHAETVDSVADDQLGALHDRGGHRRRRRLLGGEDDREATLDVEALGDLLRRGPQNRPRGDDQHQRERQE